jgi:hypothetical protein
MGLPACSLVLPMPGTCGGNDDGTARQATKGDREAAFRKDRDPEGLP